LTRFPLFARALNADPAHLLRLALEQYWPEWKKVINEILEALSAKMKLRFLLAIRKATGDRDPKFSPSQIIGPWGRCKSSIPLRQAAAGGDRPNLNDACVLTARTLLGMEQAVRPPFLPGVLVRCADANLRLG